MLTKVKKGISDYVVYDLSGIAVLIDKVSMMMINSNQNEQIGLAPISLEEMNGIYYRMLFDITGKVPLADYIKNNISQEEFRQMLLSMIHAIEQFDEYMIDIEKKQILLDTEYVYINPVDHSISFICVALQNIEQDYDLYSFFREVVQDSDVALNQNEISYFNHAYRIIKGQDGGFSLPNLKTAMNKGYQAKSPAEPQKNEPQVQQYHPQPETFGVQTVHPKPPKSVEEIPESEPEPAEEKKKKGLGGLGDALGNIFQFGKKKPSSGYQGGISKFKGKSASENTADESEEVSAPVVSQQTERYSSETQQVPLRQTFHQGTTVLKGKMADYYPESAPPGTTVLNKKAQAIETEIPGTTVLNGKNIYPPDTTVLKKTACLIRLKKNHERFLIHKSRFTIGRGEKDCAVDDNTNVSRHHADIVQRGAEYFLVVITETNVTYLNEVSVENGTEIKLSDGDKIRLADEEFEFRIA